MLLREEREKIVEYGKKMYHDRLVRGTGGNISIKNTEKNLVAISPSGKDYQSIKVDDISVVDVNGEKIEGNYNPSSEISMHLILLNKREDINSVVHTHSTFASAFSCLRKELPPIYYLMMVTGGSVACADYALSGSTQLAQNVLSAISDRNAALLANHGVVTGAQNLEIAYYIAEQVEFAAELYLKAYSTNTPPVPLDAQEQSEMVSLFQDLGYGIGSAQ